MNLTNLIQTNHLKFSILILFVFFMCGAQAQDFIIYGKITDETGSPLRGVTIRKVNTNTATISNKNGEFSYQTDTKTPLLRISKLGYIPTEILAKANAPVYLELQKEEKSYFKDTVQVLANGYSQWKENNTSGYISRLDLKSWHYSENNLSTLLLYFAGVQIQNENSFPGSNSNLFIRGNESLIGSQPLIIVDGLELNAGINMPNALVNLSPLNTIHSEDINTIQVIRSAAAAGIYGSKGANGVILIETKKGKRNEFRVSNHSKFGIGFQPRREETMNTNSYFNILNESLLYAGENMVALPVEGSSEDWGKYISKASFSAEHILALSGGSEKSDYYISGNVKLSTGPLKSMNFNSGGIRFNNNLQVWERLHLGINLSYSETKLKSPLGNINRWSANPVVFAQMYAPVRADVAKEYKGIMDYFGIRTPEEIYSETQSKSKASFMNGAFSVRYQMSEYFSFKSVISGDYTYFDEEYMGFQPASKFAFSENKLKSSKQFLIYNWKFSNILKFQKLTGKHEFMILAGWEEAYINATNELQNVYLPHSLNETVRSEEKLYNTRRNSSQLASLKYGFNQRFDLAGSFRREVILNQNGTNEHGLFPTFSTGVWLKKENKEDWFSALKLQMGWGIPGANQFYALYYPGSNNINEGEYEPEYRRNYRWEIVEEWNFGAHSSWFENSIQLTFNYFDRLRENVAYMYAGPVSQEIKWAYTGRVHNPGYELEFTFKKDIGNTGIFLNAGLQSTNPEVLSLGEKASTEAGFIFEGGNSELLGSFTRNEAPGALFGYMMEGIQQNKTVDLAAGDIIFADLNGDEIIDEKDRTVIGNTNPEFIYNVNGGFLWKAFDLTFLVQGVQGNQVLQLDKIWSEATGGWGNRSQRMHGRWTVLNGTNVLPRVQMYDPNSNSRIHSGMVVDGSYACIAKLELGYKMDRKSGKVNRLYLAGRNFGQISKNTSTRINTQGTVYGGLGEPSSIVIGLQLGI